MFCYSCLRISPSSLILVYHAQQSRGFLPKTIGIQANSSVRTNRAPRAGKEGTEESRTRGSSGPLLRARPRLPCRKTRPGRKSSRSGARTSTLLSRAVFESRASRRRVMASTAASGHGGSTEHVLYREKNGFERRQGGLPRPQRPQNQCPYVQCVSLGDGTRLLPACRNTGRARANPFRVSSFAPTCSQGQPTV